MKEVEVNWARWKDNAVLQREGRDERARRESVGRVQKGRRRVACMRYYPNPSAMPKADSLEIEAERHFGDITHHHHHHLAAVPAVNRCRRRKHFAAPTFALGAIHWGPAGSSPGGSSNGALTQPRQSASAGSPARRPPIRMPELAPTWKARTSGRHLRPTPSPVGQPPLPPQHLRPLSWPRPPWPCRIGRCKTKILGCLGGHARAAQNLEPSLPARHGSAAASPAACVRHSNALHVLPPAADDPPRRSRPRQLLLVPGWFGSRSPPEQQRLRATLRNHHRLSWLS